jgi:hypothetical protein
MLDVAPDLGLIVAAVVGIGLMVRATSSPSAEMASVPVDARAVAKFMRR